MATWAYKKEHWMEQARISRRKSYHKMKALREPTEKKPRKKQEPRVTKEHKAEVARKNEKLSYQRKQAFIVDVKAISGCFRCIEEDPCALTFHHRDRTKKKFELGSKGYKHSYQDILIEMLKCDILCFNCHAKLHRDERLLT